jgi:PilZ domain-containing protein
VDQRRESRQPINQDVTVTVLSGTKKIIQGKAVDLSGRGLRLVLPMHIPLDTALQIDIGDRSLLGEVAYSAGGPTEWQTGVEVAQALRHTAQLEQLNQCLTGGDLYGRGDASDLRVARPVTVPASVLEADVTMKVIPHGNRETGAEEDRQPAAYRISAKG